MQEESTLDPPSQLVGNIMLHILENAYVDTTTSLIGTTQP